MQSRISYKLIAAVGFVAIVIIGILVGLEIPLLLRILKDQLQFKDLVASQGQEERERGNMRRTVPFRCGLRRSNTIASRRESRLSRDVPLPRRSWPMAAQQGEIVRPERRPIEARLIE